MAELPTYLQKINGYQRFGEMTQLWFGIWAGRPLVEAPNLVFVPLLRGSVYLLAKRYSGDRVVSIAWAVAFLLVPGNARLLQSTMVDPHAAALFVTATFYASEKDLRPRQAWLAIVALTMAVGTKTFLLIRGFVLAVLVLVRLIRHRKELGARTTGAIVGGGSALLVGMVAFTHLRNYLNFKNPVWPDLSVDVPKFGILWVGTNVLFDDNLPTDPARERERRARRPLRQDRRDALDEHVGRPLVADRGLRARRELARVARGHARRARPPARRAPRSRVETPTKEADRRGSGLPREARVDARLAHPRGLHGVPCALHRALPHGDGRAPLRPRRVGSRRTSARSASPRACRSCSR